MLAQPNATGQVRRRPEVRSSCAEILWPDEDLNVVQAGRQTVKQSIDLCKAPVSGDKSGQPVGVCWSPNGEIKRRTEIVGFFPNEVATIRFVGAILLEANDEWAVQRSSYMKLESVTLFGKTPLFTLPGMAA